MKIKTAAAARDHLLELISFIAARRPSDADFDRVLSAFAVLLFALPDPLPPPKASPNHPESPK